MQPVDDAEVAGVVDPADVARREPDAPLPDIGVPEVDERVARVASGSSR